MEGRKTSCEHNNADTTLRSDASSTAPNKTERVKLPPTVHIRCGTYVPAEASVQEDLNRTKRHDSGNSATRDCTGSAYTHLGSRDCRKLPVQHDEADVSFPAMSIGEASQRGNWIAGCRAMLPGLSGEESNNT